MPGVQSTPGESISPGVGFEDADPPAASPPKVSLLAKKISPAISQTSLTCTTTRINLDDAASRIGDPETEI